MISLDNLIDGNEYWYCYLFIGSQGAIGRFEKPIKLKYKVLSIPEMISGGWDKIIGKFYRIGVLNSPDTVFMDFTEKGTSSLYHLFYTEEDCISYWNDIIYNNLDRLDSDIKKLEKEYENKLRILESRRDKCKKELIEFKL